MLAGFDLTTRDSYFTVRIWSFHKSFFSRKHIFHESFRVNRTQDYGLQTCKQVQNYTAVSYFWKHSYRRFPSSSSFLSSKGFINIIFSRGWKQQNDKTRQLTIQTFIYYLICSDVRKTFRKIMQHKEIWFALQYGNVSFRKIIILC